ncbi:AMP-binding protein [Aliikangiella sp. G2MR2-5]|uniref:AMP-binding protein n=1 Tax=Aliikangiella sp. G2MR2-5 TaxID=2788943 RepID=UPI0018A95AD6|nr:AMP-binding protein [Aliikangiella sp. G2MR2-5]
MPFISPHQMLLDSGKKRGKKVFLHQPIGKGYRLTTWADAYQQVMSMVSYLVKFPKGSKIGIYSLNCDRWIMADLAIMIAGHVSVPIYPTASARTISFIEKHAELKLVFIGKLNEAIPKGAFTSQIEKVSIFTQDSDLPFWNDIINQNSPAKSIVMPDPLDVATIVYTSGTTGESKGVVISYLALYNAFESIRNTFNVSSEERFFSYLPLAHVAERVAVEMGAVFYGASIYFVEKLDTFAENLRFAQPSIFFGVPRIWLKLKQNIESRLGGERILSLLLNLPVMGIWLKKKIVAKLGLENAWLCLSGAASISKEVIEWYEELGIVIYEVYGMSETLGIATANAVGKRKVGTVGKPLHNCKILIADNQEILLQVPSMMKEYYKLPELTQAAIQDDWFRTGDLGAVDEEGYLRITGRAKDLFKTSKGKYIAPTPIEQNLASLFKCDNVCVMGEGLAQPVAIVSMQATTLSQTKKNGKQIASKLNLLNQQLEKHEKLGFLGLTSEEWNSDNELLTPTLKIRRQAVETYYKADVAKLMKSGKRWGILEK